MKVIKIMNCKGCPHFADTGVNVKGQDGNCLVWRFIEKVTNRDVIPDWCPLEDE